MIQDRIAELKKRKNAVILAHFYQMPEIQDIADFVGDSLELSRRARDVDADVIVFCGVWFMAGSAKLLSPSKIVMIANGEAGCPMADMATAGDVARLREMHPKAAVVTYVNSSVEVKAVSDICCTSSNAVRIVESLPNAEIIFVPDRNLGSYVARFTDKKIITFNGYCPTHHRVFIEHVDAARRAQPNAELLVHPECVREVVDAADFVGSTAQIIAYAGASSGKEFIIGTEEGVLHPLKRQNPDKRFYMLSDRLICPNMKKTSLEDVVACLEEGVGAIEIDPGTADAAATSLFRMLEVK
ncbi:MAG: quinolinate synthase NadA [Clostridiales Family XIII bacterium]|jgi:quinolinate synthase|nr:quinolinate synthase NadA [Clostridiales Family XIII bacterium]